MSEETSQVEQITREPSVKTKVKDPKRVQAGKTLSEKNKRTREALKREEEREKKEREESEKEEDKGSSVGGGGDWIPKYMSSQTIILAIGAIGLTAYSLWNKYRDRIPNLNFSTITLNPSPQPRVIESQPAKEEDKTNLKSSWM